MCLQTFIAPCRHLTVICVNSKHICLFQVAYLTAFSFAITAAFTDFWLEESIDDQSLGVIQQQQQHKQIESALQSATDDALKGEASSSKFTIDQQASTG